MTDLTSNFSGYDGFLHNLKERTQTAQIRASIAVNEVIVQQPAGRISRCHTGTLLDKVRDETETLWYAPQTVEIESEQE